MPLSEIKVRNLKPKDKSCKISDSDGRYLLIAEKSSKLWRFKYCFDAKEKLLALGTYPEIGLYDARQRRDEARRQLAHDIDSSVVRKAKKQASITDTETFELIAREWHERFKTTWKAEKLYQKRLKTDPLSENLVDLHATVRYLALLDEQSALKSKVKEADAALDKLVYDKYPQLSVDEIKTLVVNDKWLVTLAMALQGELDRVSQTPTTCLQPMKRATPLPHP